MKHVTRCHQEPLHDGNKKSIPTLFSGYQDDAEPGATLEMLDIRTVDREVLEMEAGQAHSEADQKYQV